MGNRYTSREVGRILGLDEGRLRYWERLRLVRPRAKWGARFYNFGDLVALRNIQRLTDKRVPARHVRRAVALMERELGSSPLSVQNLRFVEQGRDLLVIPPGGAQPFNPVKRQWAFRFDHAGEAPELHSMAGPTPEQLFEAALKCEARQNLLPQAVENYERALKLVPNWVDAHINRGVALYQLGRVDDALAAFRSAVQLNPQNGISRYNLGCVLEEQGEIDEAIRHLRCAASEMPDHADVHFNLALAYEKKNERRLAREHWTSYLRYSPNGQWADEARARLKQYSAKRKASPPIPFPRPS